MSKFLAYWCDRNHHLHYWRLIATGWLIALIGAFPALSLIWGSDALWPFVILLSFPGLAHLYGFLANLKYISNWDAPGRVGPALVGVTYFLAAFIGLFQMDVFLALTLPLSSILIALLTFGILFTGFMPLLAFWLIHLLLTPEVTTRSYIISFVLMTTSWLVAMQTGYFFGNL